MLRGSRKRKGETAWGRRDLHAADDPGLGEGGRGRGPGGRGVGDHDVPLHRRARARGVPAPLAARALSHSLVAGWRRSLSLSPAVCSAAAGAGGESFLDARRSGGGALGPFEG